MDAVASVLAMSPVSLLRLALLQMLGLIAIALYISFVLLVNPEAGRAVFPVTAGPMFKPTPPPAAPVVDVDRAA